MRTYGRVRDPVTGEIVPDPATGMTWRVVETDAAGYDDLVWTTTLCQVLLLNLGESPFYAQYGIPAVPTIVQQVQPDYYVARTQAQFSQYFANLVVAKQGGDPPSYKVNITTHQGARIGVDLKIPQ